MERGFPGGSLGGPPAPPTPHGSGGQSSLQESLERGLFRAQEGDGNNGLRRAFVGHSASAAGPRTGRSGGGEVSMGLVSRGSGVKAPRAHRAGVLGF